MRAISNGKQLSAGKIQRLPVCFYMLAGMRVKAHKFFNGSAVQQPIFVVLHSDTDSVELPTMHVGLASSSLQLPGM